MKDGVVMLVNEFPPLPVGGAERQAERLSEYLIAHGWRVIVLTRRIGHLPAQEHRNGVQIIRPATIGPGKVQTITFLFGALLELWMLRKKYKILHAHLAFGPALGAVLAARLLGKKVIVKLGNSGAYGDIQTSQRSFRGRFRLAIVRRWTDVIIILDEEMRKEALAAGFESARLQRMNNGIDASAFPQTHHKTETIDANQPVNVLYVGRLTAQKSLPTLLKAFAQALPACLQLHLTLVGEGEERPKLEAEIQTLGIYEYVTFAGGQADVRPYLNNADIFVLPSAAEGISNALLEAMSTGLACMATPVGGNVMVLEHGECGLLLPHADVNSWSQALVALGNDSKARTRLGTAARQRILNVFDFSVVGAHYETLYTQLLTNA